MADDAERFSNLPTSLHNALLDLTEHPWPHVPSPPSAKKRASVALVIRVRPGFESQWSQANLGSESGATKDRLAAYFSQEWVKSGDPEALFIKRLNRYGDRWSGHVALPGGGRDPEDESDLATAIRETQEEVGLDLSSPQCIPVGNLPERIISTTWGKQVLMVICPYLFLWTSPTSPALKLQPTEIAATHWVPVRALLAPIMRTQETADFSDRLTQQRGPIVKTILRAFVGHMSFSAIRLIPSESLFTTTAADFLPATPSSSSFGAVSRLKSLLAQIDSHPNEPPSQPPLNLWGLTLGILADFLEQFPPHDAVKMWTYPTFTPPDFRFIIYLMTYTKRKQNARNLNDGTRAAENLDMGNQTAVDATTAAVAISSSDSQDENVAGNGVSGSRNDPTHAIGTLLDGYYDRMKYAIMLFIAWRFTASVTAAVMLVRWWRSRRR